MLPRRNLSQCGKNTTPLSPSQKNKRSDYTSRCRQGAKGVRVHSLFVAATATEHLGTLKRQNNESKTKIKKKLARHQTSDDNSNTRGTPLLRSGDDKKKQRHSTDSRRSVQSVDLDRGERECLPPVSVSVAAQRRDIGTIAGESTEGEPRAVVSHRNIYTLYGVRNGAWRALRTGVNSLFSSTVKQKCRNHITACTD